MEQTITKRGKIHFFFACLFFASLNFEMFSIVGDSFSVSKLCMILYILSSLPMGIGCMFGTQNIGKYLRAVFVMFVFMVLSSIANKSNMIFDTTMFFNILMFWVLLNHFRRDDRLFDQGLLFFALSGSLVSILFHFGIGVEASSDIYSSRLSIFGDNENIVGFKMTLGILFLLNYCLNGNVDKPIRYPWLLLCIAPMLQLLFATASRSAFLMLAVGLLYFVIARPTKKKSTKFLWLAFGAVLLFLAYKLVLEQEVLISRLLLTAETGSLSSRDVIWKMYLDLIFDNPILGVGFSGGLETAMHNFGMARSPHNVFIEVALYSGLLGFIPFMYFIYHLYKNGLLYKRIEKNLAPILLLIGVLGMLLSGQALNVKLFWVVAAYAISFQIKQNQVESI